MNAKIDYGRNMWAVQTPKGLVAVREDGSHALFFRKKDASDFAWDLSWHVGKCRVAKVWYSLKEK
jgi:hypothetical protein